MVEPVWSGSKLDFGRSNRGLGNTVAGLQMSPLNTDFRGKDPHKNYVDLSSGNGLTTLRILLVGYKGPTIEDLEEVMLDARRDVLSPMGLDGNLLINSLISSNSFGSRVLRVYQYTRKWDGRRCLRPAGAQQSTPQS